MFGAIIEIMWEEQLVDPQIHFLTNMDLRKEEAPLKCIIDDNIFTSMLIQY